MWTQQIEDAPLGETCQLSQCDSQNVERQRQRLPVKIASAQHITVLWKNEWVVGHCIQLAFENVGAVLYSIAEGFEDLRRASHRIGILHALAIFVAGVDLALPPNVAHLCLDHLMVFVGL